MFNAIPTLIASIPHNILWVNDKIIPNGFKKDVIIVGENDSSIIFRSSSDYNILGYL